MIYDGAPQDVHEALETPERKEVCAKYHLPMRYFLSGKQIQDGMKGLIAGLVTRLVEAQSRLNAAEETVQVYRDQVRNTEAVLEEYTSFYQTTFGDI